MLYQSSLSNDKVSASYAILNSMDEKGSLYIPENIPQIALEQLYNMDYQSIAYVILKEYFNEFDSNQLKEAIANAYNSKNFTSPTITKLVSFDKYSYLELFHGQTYAFKDMALSLYPHLVNLALNKEGNTSKIHILTATSGDTGKAALEAVKDLDNISISVIYPVDGVSQTQKDQMSKQEGANVDVISIKGNFDDAQNLVKEIFNNQELNHQFNNVGYKLMSANSINIARLLPQVVYYFDSYINLVNNKVINKNDVIDITVPTGNFGNILSAIIAKRMGLPIDKLICATNTNDVLNDFIKTGIYDIRSRKLHLTSAPSMDILISSNLERYLALTFAKNEVSKMIEDLRQNRCFKLNEEQLAVMHKDLKAEAHHDEDILKSIKEEFENNNYLVDPHTALAKLAYDKNVSLNHNLIVATASIFKFANTVEEAFANTKTIIELSNEETPTNIKKLDELTVRFNQVLDIEEVLPYLNKKLGVNCG